MNTLVTFRQGISVSGLFWANRHWLAGSGHGSVDLPSEPTMFLRPVEKCQLRAAISRSPRGSASIRGYQFSWTPERPR